VVRCALIDRQASGRWRLATLGLMLWLTTTTAAWAISLPADGGQLNVRGFGAIPNDGKDDTAALQAALNAAKEMSMVYVPNGSWCMKLMMASSMMWPRCQNSRPCMFRAGLCPHRHPESGLRDLRGDG
jgi:hypothetical protein